MLACKSAHFRFYRAKPATEMKQSGIEVQHGGQPGSQKKAMMHARMQISAFSILFNI